MSTAKEVRCIACAWSKAFAADDSHGYDQGSRLGNPDTDCSMLVILAYKNAGLPLTCTYTGNMRPDMLTHGFKDVTAKIDLSSGAGLTAGDVLLHETHHAALYIGSGRIVHATGNELGCVTGGQPGDQTGREICVAGYFNYPWQYVLRYEGKTTAETPAQPVSDTYVVQSGDTLSAISWRVGVSVVDLAKANGISNVNLIFPGQVLRIPGAAAPEPDPQPEKATVRLPVLRRGDSGKAVLALQALLLNAGIDVGPSGIDGDFGEDTWVAVCDFQRERGSTVDGVVSGPIWTALIC